MLESTRKQKDESILLIVQDIKQQKKYLSLARSLHINLQTLNKLQSIDDIVAKNSTSWLWVLVESGLQRYVPEKLWDIWFSFETGNNYSMEYIIKNLIDLWYEHSEYDSPWSYYRKWDTITIHRDWWHILYLSFFGDELEEIRNNNDILIPEIHLYPRRELHEEIVDTHVTYISLLDLLQTKSSLHIIGDTLSIHSRDTYFEVFESYTSLDILGEYNKQRNVVRLPYQRPICKNFEDLKKTLTQSATQWYIYSKHSQLVSEFLKLNWLSHIPLTSTEHPLTESFSMEGTIIICDDILSQLFVKKRSSKKLSQDVDLLLKLQTDDYVVHIDHGIGIYKGITQKNISSENNNTLIKEYLEIHYDKEEKLFVPISELSRVSKYVGIENPKLHPLKWKSWQKKMKKVQDNIVQIAEELLETFAKRTLRIWQKNIFDTEKLDTFIESFPYNYTDDQIQAREDILNDMKSEKNMDRLIVGDVWFWKTELAFIAMYTAILSGKQAVIISPLVVLAHEHYSKALDRFMWLWCHIEILTRLQSRSEVKKVLRWLELWEIDIVVGTHRLLSEDVRYKNLWLLVIDEEHKFWVQDKEKIKKIRTNIDILSLSATPIPRSLNLALSWVRDISLLKTPPLGRKSIETYVSRYNTEIIKEAWKREFSRWGQVFFIHNRVTTLEVYRQELEKLFPHKKIVTIHGQLPWDELEDRIIDFKNRKFDILLSTTVIENGIDFSNVNTIFINECQQFWISQIHQLRGRVGRSDSQAYCYLLYKKQELDKDASKRLQTIVDYSYLWAGFELAMKDLEIRGWWDILGVKQSGQGKEIGVSLFLKLLEEKIAALKDWSTPQQQRPRTQVDIALDTYVSDEYFLSEADKLNFYREIQAVEDLQELEILKTSMLDDTKSEESHSLHNLFLLTRLSLIWKEYVLSSVKKIWKHYTLNFDSWVTYKIITRILKNDKKMYLNVVNWERLRAEVKDFTSPVLFIQYLLDVLR